MRHTAQNNCNCGAEFGFLTWRHNCLGCNRVFCSNCLVSSKCTTCRTTASRVTAPVSAAAYSAHVNTTSTATHVAETTSHIRPEPHYYVAGDEGPPGLPRRNGSFFIRDEQGTPTVFANDRDLGQGKYGKVSLFRPTHVYRNGVWEQTYANIRYAVKKPLSPPGANEQETANALAKFNCTIPAEEAWAQTGDSSFFFETQQFDRQNPHNSRARVIMSYAPGATLKCVSFQRYKNYEILDLFAALAEKLHQHHRQGRIHRDFHLGNIIINTSFFGRSFQASDIKIIDGGLSVGLNEQHVSCQLRPGGDRRPFYPPELFHDESERPRPYLVQPYIDVYSFCYWIQTIVNFFAQNGRADMLISENLRQLLDQGLAADPNSRPTLPELIVMLRVESRMKLMSQPLDMLFSMTMKQRLIDAVDLKIAPQLNEVLTLRMQRQLGDMEREFNGLHAQKETMFRQTMDATQEHFARENCKDFFGKIAGALSAANISPGVNDRVGESNRCVYDLQAVLARQCNTTEEYLRCKDQIMNIIHDYLNIKLQLRVYKKSKLVSALIGFGVINLQTYGISEDFSCCGSSATPSYAKTREKVEPAGSILCSCSMRLRTAEPADILLHRIQPLPKSIPNPV